MAILAALQSATLRVVGQRPTAFFGGSETIAVEMSDLANEVAQDVSKYQDWQALIRIGTITGDGSQTDFALPDDYDRMLQNASVQDLGSWFWGYHAYTDINGFLFDEARAFNAYPGGWIIYANQLRFSPVPAAAQSASFPYITKKWAIDASTTPKEAFTADTDTFALPERLLTLSLVWRWRENKKLDATGDQEAFIKALDEYAAKDKGARTFRRNSHRFFPGTYPAWPGELGPASYWPAG